MTRSETLVLASTAIFCASPSFAASPGETEDARAKGRRLYLEAREAAGGGQPLRDYSVELSTIVTTPQDQKVRFDSRVDVVAPYVLRQEIDSNIGKIKVVSDGEKAWKKTTQGVEELPPDAVRFQRAETDRGNILFGEVPPEGDIRYRGEETVDGKTVDVIEIVDVGGAPLRLFLERERRDLVKMMYVGDVRGAGMTQVEEYFSDFRDVDGFRMRFTRRVVRNGKESSRSTASSYRVNTGLRSEDLLR